MFKFILSLNQSIYESLDEIARERGITMQELLRAVVIPEWIRLSGASQKKHRNAQAETPA